MSQVLHAIEKKIIAALQERGAMTYDALGAATGLSSDQVRRGTEWLRLKELAAVSESREVFVSLGRNGADALANGLPERRLLDLVRDGPRPIALLQERLGDLFGPAMGAARQNGWISSRDGAVSAARADQTIPYEPVIGQIGTSRIRKSQIRDAAALAAIEERPDFVTYETVVSKSIELSGKARDMDVSGQPGGIDVEADVPAAHAARVHPLTETIREIREIFVTLGFSEIRGSITQSSFWNFDALFTPQDHPAREMQDTFYMDRSYPRVATERQIRGVSASHRSNWRYRWSRAEAHRTVLRTHTTCVTIRHLAEHRPDEARVFSLGRVFRNEKPSYKHLVEFNQVEGVLTGRDATLRDLMGIQKEFYRRMGLDRVKFWPTFFPYTEPSLQTMVYNRRLGKWVEMFGMGIFRPEVTEPLGITRPVLAWGGGIERIAMMRYGVDDVREFYNNDLGWLRSASRCR